MSRSNLDASAKEASVISSFIEKQEKIKRTEPCRNCGRAARGRIYLSIIISTLFWIFLAKWN